MERRLTCSVGNHSFILHAEDLEAYGKFGFEPLPICFPHQHQWRLAFRNDRFLHRRTCDLTRQSIISMYPQDVPYKVYEHEAWFSDQWDPLSYGRPYDFNRPFFKQYVELQREVPRLALVNIGSTNSDYCNSCVYNKNCYLIFGGDRNEDCLYGALPMFCRSCVDCDWTINCELCYFCAYLENCYQCRFSFHSKSCNDCAFVEDCIGCSDCILSFNLRNKQYTIENKSYSKEDYFKKKKELLNGSFKTQQQLWQRFLELRQQRAVKYAHLLNVENATGDILSNAKNCFACYEVVGGEDCREIYMGLHLKDCFNSDYLGEKSELNYNNVSTDTGYRAWFSYWTVNASDIEYCELTNGSQNLFGCIGLRQQQYCILNHRYSKEEFFELRARIIEHMKSTGEWGYFFPKLLSTFPYNESTASFYSPLSKSHALAQGFHWRDEPSVVSSTPVILPDSIEQVPDSIPEVMIPCEATDKPFKITSQELAFYRSQNIPLPRRHHDQRYHDRLALKNPPRLHKRKCQQCGLSLQSPYSPERPEKILCEACYSRIVD